MDPAVIQLLEALMKILQHAHRPTPKAMEVALEAVQQLVSHRYVAGSAGGADDPAQSMTRKLTDHSENERTASSQQQQQQQK
mmetsp:Transcript_13444/g.25584  ORF Transcript_13444/g.25584 Transcript_13444/m.25584 type:complete len:82 (+) Transcript_13444:1057-1302(+)